MRTPSKIITALALAGLAVAGGAAFTAPGLDNTVADNSAFIGGGVNQVITGATLLDVDYEYSTPIDGNAEIQKVTLTFDANTPDGSLATIKFHNPESTWKQKTIEGYTVSWTDADGTGTTGADNPGEDVAITAANATADLTNMDVVVVSGTTG
jgi:hypothetical protein